MWWWNKKKENRCSKSQGSEGQGDSLPASAPQHLSAELPKFKYHPDPVATGSITQSKTRCCCCGQAHGYIYIGPVYAEKEYDSQICPWCIADGSAHTKLDATFTDEAGIGECGDGKAVPQEVEEEIAFRTPGFCGWQQEQWWTHCGDAGQFLGRAGHDELAELGREAIEAIRESTGLANDDEWQEFFDELDKDGSPTAYIFRCCKCGKLGGYQDCD